MACKVTSKDVYELTPFRIIARGVSRALESLGVQVEERTVEFIVSESPNPAYGDYGVPLARFARSHSVGFEELASRTIRALSSEPVVESVKTVHGFLNIRVNAAVAARALVEAYRCEGEGFGMVKSERPLRIVVEHTSANPVHPLHIGHARNACLGDTLARLLKARGHSVETRFYVNDMGRQIAVMVYGFILAGLEDVPSNVKPDHYIGLVYAITHTLADIEQLKRLLERLKAEGRDEEYRERLRELDSLVADASRLRERNPELFDRIAEAIKGRNPEEDIQELMRKYEYRLDSSVVRLFQRLVSRCLEGFRKTLRELGVSVDKWDWESRLVWEGVVGEILEKARLSPYAVTYKDALALNLQPLLSDPSLREKLGVPQGYEVPPLILQRSDGTTLYTTRDIAYSIVKFAETGAQKVINVIAAEQRLEQLQVRLALIALGYMDYGLNMLHYAYEMVNLPGRKMSGRRGRYVTLDELLAQARSLAREEVEKRSPQLPDSVKDEVAKAVGTAAVRYSLVSVAAPKPLTFNVKDALNYEQNSAPYVLYAHARASSILAKARERGIELDWSGIGYDEAARNPLRRALVLHVLNYPYVFVKAADEYKPELLVAYLNRLADLFNKWYTSGDSVVNEPNPAARNFKLALVNVVKQVLANTLSILGVKPLERM